MPTDAPSSRRIVITGMGVVSPNGVGRDAYVAAIRQGKSGLKRFHDTSSFGVRTSAVGRVDDLPLDSVLDTAELKRLARVVPLALVASREALHQARFQPADGDLEARRSVGVLLGTGGGGLAFIEEQYGRMYAGQNPSLYGITAGTHGNLSSELSIALGLRGMSHLISTGCTSSTDALGYAMMTLRGGSMPAMLVGGADAPIAPGILCGFERMRVVSTRRWDQPCRSSRPFSSDRDGFVLGEGAWMFMVETFDHARSRGATPLAELAGYGSTCDAYHRVQIKPDVVEPARAIELALADAGVSPADIDYVNLHGTSTELNDRMETLAMRRVFGDAAYRVPMSSTKSMIGHPQGACGAAGLAATIGCMTGGFAHPTINLDQPDPSCDLDYVPNTARPLAIEIALCNCIAFGSKNSALVVRKFRD